MSATLVEIAGLAGCGKSSVADLLRQRWDPPLEIYRIPRLRSLPRLVAALPTALPRAVGARDVATARHELWRLLHYQAMAADLATWRRRARRPGILDQGPVYAYTAACRDIRLGRLGPWLLPPLERALDRFAPHLDVVVHLDAPDPVLVDRVSARAKRHEIEDYDAEGTLRFLAEFREHFDATLRRLEERHATPVVRVSNDGCSLESTAERVIVALAERGIRVTP